MRTSRRMPRIAHPQAAPDGTAARATLFRTNTVGVATDAHGTAVPAAHTVEAVETEVTPPAGVGHWLALPLEG